MEHPNLDDTMPPTQTTALGDDPKSRKRKRTVLPCRPPRGAGALAPDGTGESDRTIYSSENENENEKGQPLAKRRTAIAPVFLRAGARKDPASGQASETRVLLDNDGARVTYIPAFLPRSAADALLAAMLERPRVEPAYDRGEEGGSASAHELGKGGMATSGDEINAGEWVAGRKGGPGDDEVCTEGDGDGVAWGRDIFSIMGRKIPAPRMMVAMGDRGLSYTYTGNTRPALPWSDRVSEVRELVEARVGCPYNYCLQQLYVDGAAYIRWHSDAEADLVPGHPIASLSVGFPRRFQIRPKSRRGNSGRVGGGDDRDCDEGREGRERGRERGRGKGKGRGGKGGRRMSHPLSVDVELEHGSLLIIEGERMQRDYEHRVPPMKSGGQVRPRVNFTFRSVKRRDGDNDTATSASHDRGRGHGGTPAQE